MWGMFNLLVMLALAASPPDVPEVLQAIDNGDRACSQLRIRYRDGNDTLGSTIVLVGGSYGRVIRQSPDGTVQEFRGRLPKGMCRRLVRKAVAYEVWRTRKVRRQPGDDETRPSLRIGIKGKQIRLSMPGFAVQDRPAFAVLRGQLLVIARALSDGAVLY